MLKIERMQEKDFAEVEEISRQRFGAFSWQIELFESELSQKDHFAFVARLDGKVVSFLVFMKTFSDVFGDEFNILNIATKKEYENMGIATEMFAFMRNFGKQFNIKNLWLEVRESNLNAIKFYSNYGFKKDYIRKKYYADGENAIVMSCSV